MNLPNSIRFILSLKNTLPNKITKGALSYNLVYFISTLILINN